MKKTKGLKAVTALLLLLCLGLSLANPALALDNTGTVGSGTVYTDDAFYYSDQFMWKASLFVAKADTVNRADATMADFHRIGSEAVYLSPVADWSGWVGGDRPGNVKSLEFTTGNKMDTLQELKDKGGNVNALDPVVFTNSGGVNMITGVPNLPYPPQMCDGIIGDNGVVYPEYVGTLTKVTDYFGKGNTIFNLLNYYASQQGQTPQDLVSNLEFTINGETRKNWNPEGILPKAIAGNVADTDSSGWNHVNQVEWLIVYEPCTIVYTKVTGGYKAYVMTATDFAVTQIKKQMDWRYDEGRMSSWAGLQPDAWAPNGDRQHVAKLSHLVVGNSVIIKEGWYGLEATANTIDQNAAPPYSRWTSEDELKFGGWGMSLWEKPSTADTPLNYDFNDNTEVIYATDIFSNVDTQPGQELTVTYEINSETYTNTVIAMHDRKAVSYFKWHTPDVDEVTSYDLKITVSPFPKGTVDGDGNEYVHRTITVRPLVEKTPTDAKVLDTLPPDFIPEHVPGTVVGDDTLDENDMPVVKSITETSTAPYYLNDVVTLEVVTNRVTEWFDFKNVQSGDVRRLTSDSVGNGILASKFENPLNDTITWTLEFTMAHFGDNVYSATPGNTIKGMGSEFTYNLKLEEDPDIPKILSVDINPKPTEPPGFYWLYTDTKSPELKYMVIFETDSGTEMEPLMIKANTLIPKPDDPVKEGYDFMGWYKDNNFTELWDFNTEKIKGVTTLYAKFEIKKFTVFFNHNGLGAPVAPITVPYGQNIAAPAKSVVTGHIFEGWYKDSGLTEKWNFDTDVVTSNMTLYAKWRLDQFMVGFEENGGKLIADLLLDYDSLIPVPICEHEGYTLDGWFSDPACTVLWNFASDRVKNNMLLYAKWTANPSTIAFEENGGSEVADLVGVTDQTITDTTMPETLRPGYTFEGWFETEDFSSDKITQLPDKFPPGGVTYYAKWKTDISKIVFEENGGSEVADLTGLTDDPITDTTMPETLRPGYTFKGWFDIVDFSGTEITQLPDKFPAGGITYYAKWQANVSIIHYEENGAMLIPDLVGVTDQVITDRTMPDIPRDGYTLEGWYESTDFSGAAVTQLPEKFPIGSITYYAKWKSNVSVIAFEENGGSEVPDLTGVTDQVISDQDMPESLRPGYTFGGWFEASDFSGAAVTELPEKYPPGGITYHAKWTANPSIISFEENGGSEVADLTGITDQAITDRNMPETTRIDYEFVGWFTTSDFSGAAVTQLPEKFPPGGTTYYAGWKMETFRLIDLFPDPAFAEEVRLEMNKRDERLTDPIPDIYAKVVTKIDLEYVTVIESTVTLEQLFPDAAFAEAIRIEMNKRMARWLDPIVDIFEKVILRDDMDYVKELIIN